MAGARLAEGGARVCVLAKGVGSTHLAPGTIDVLGYAPERVESPSGALPEFVGGPPGSPLRRCSAPTRWPRRVRWFQSRVESGPLPGLPVPRRSLDRNHLLPTAVGALRPSALVPETMADGDSA